MRSRYEIQAEKELKADDWIVDTKSGMNRWSKNTDFFHLFDLVCVKPRLNKIRFISIKGHDSNQRQHREDIRAFWLPKNCIKELWRMPKRKGESDWIKEIL